MKNILLYLIAFVCIQNALNAQWSPTSGPILSNGYVPPASSMDVKGSTIFVGTSSGIFHSNNNGTTWTQSTNGLTNTNIRKVAVSGTNIFLATTNSGMYKSTNNGSSWTAVSNSGFSASNGINCLSAVGNNLFCSPGQNGGLYLSTDNGGTWTNVSTNLPSQFFTKVVGNGTTLFAGGTNTWASGGVFLSSDNGITWSDVNNGALTGGGKIYSLAISGSNVYAGGNNMYLSTNNGTDWTSIDNGLTGDVNALLVDGNTVYAGTIDGVFRSTNNGATWETVNTGLGNLKVKALSKVGTNIVAATDSLVWIRPLSELTVGIDALEANEIIQTSIYPNPSNGLFSIYLTNPTAKTEVEIYNILGEKVFSSNLNVDNLEIDLRNEPRGIYIYQLQRDNKTIETGKIVIE